VCGAPGERRVRPEVARGVDVRRWGRRGTGAIVACVAPRETAEVLAGAPALRESGACGPFKPTSASDRFSGPAERPVGGQGLSGVAPTRGETRQATGAQRNRQKRPQVKNELAPAPRPLRAAKKP
jgi:hypothetical protein